MAILEDDVSQTDAQLAEQLVELVEGHSDQSSNGLDHEICDEFMAQLAKQQYPLVYAAYKKCSHGFYYA